ncbi:hypothetical protein HFX_5009 (plasmid) [Haloferax mediterranei ATCC 33500]|uniref:Uncharacterized protein n=1 Tax=Haloferax mediterranei (strain ATCC 33500 / DSM 1411 / JCM 8866 / NBRC 14739 / NCIMB 2177 / R-4) TaxID=523841 RepID=I3R9D5_HALMT|nr:hypothetical protein HFX_5009 [Haloferax mediterranei ATCC 33500]
MWNTQYSLSEWASCGHSHVVCRCASVCIDGSNVYRHVEEDIKAGVDSFLDMGGKVPIEIS